MAIRTMDKQRPDAERGGELTPIERFSTLRKPETELEAVACETLDVPMVGPGKLVVAALRDAFHVSELNAAEMLLAVRTADGQHNGKLVWVDDVHLPARAVVQRRHDARRVEIPPLSTQRRGQGVGGGVC